MFSQASVCPRGGGSASGTRGCPHPPDTHTDPWTHPPPGHTHTLDPPPPPPRSTSGRYASYWNAFLFNKYLIISKGTVIGTLSTLSPPPPNYELRCNTRLRRNLRELKFAGTLYDSTKFTGTHFL